MKLLFAALACLLLGGVGARVTIDEALSVEDALRQVVVVDRPQGACTGWVLDAAKRIIVTNRHCVVNAPSIWVTTHNGTKRLATLVGESRDNDVAVLTITDGDLLQVRMPTMALRLLDKVYAIGHPAGYNYTVSDGIVQYLARRLSTGIFASNNFIQHQAVLNGGNSGGPLFNERWEIVGMNTQIFTRGGGWDGHGFSIPIADVMIEVNKILGTK